MRNLLLLVWFFCSAIYGSQDQLCLYTESERVTALSEFIDPWVSKAKEGFDFEENFPEMQDKMLNNLPAELLDNDILFVRESGYKEGNIKGIELTCITEIEGCGGTYSACKAMFIDGTVSCRSKKLVCKENKGI